MDYRPPQKILERYADVLVNFALGRGKGIRTGEVVHVVAYEYSKPLFFEIRKAILNAGGHIIADYRPDNTEEMPFDRAFFEYAKEHQLNFFPRKHVRGLIDEIDHSLFVLSDTDKQALSGIAPKKIMQRNVAWKDWMLWRAVKENKGKYSWTIGMYGTPAMAKEAGLDLKSYWEQIIKACFLDKKNPIAMWRGGNQQKQGFKKKLDALAIENIHISGPDTDLWVRLGKDRQWLGGSGANIPSFEIFTSPDWRGTDGWVSFIGAP